MNKVVFNTNKLTIADDLIRCQVDSISGDGIIILSGYMPETQRLLAIGVEFKIYNSDDELLVSGKVLKVVDKEVRDVVVLHSSDTMTTTLWLELLCDISYCKFFEPIAYFGGVSDRPLPDNVPEGTVYHTE